jgi:hypothetical protein
MLVSVRSISLSIPSSIEEQENDEEECMCWDLNSRGDEIYIYERKKWNDVPMSTVPLVSSSPLSPST